MTNEFDDIINGTSSFDFTNSGAKHVQDFCTKFATHLSTNYIESSITDQQSQNIKAFVKRLSAVNRVYFWIYVCSDPSFPLLETILEHSQQLKLIATAWNNLAEETDVK
jgi:hypothetical protein